MAWKIAVEPRDPVASDTGVEFEMVNLRSPVLVPRRRRPGSEGSVMVFGVISLLALMALMALATDSGKVWVARDQLRGATDSAALAGAGALLTVSNGEIVVDPAAAIAAVQSFGPRNTAMHQPINIAAADIQTGNWDEGTRTFTAIPVGTNLDEVNAVRVVGRRDSTLNDPISTVFGRAVGVDSIPVASMAVAFRDWASQLPPAIAVLPIVIDCCAISNNTGDTCTVDYCAYIDKYETDHGEPIAACDMVGNIDGALEEVQATCLEVNPHPSQNVCMSVFDGNSPSVNTPDLLDLVRNGNHAIIGGPDNLVYLDNGTKIPMLREIQDRFENKGSYEDNGVNTSGDSGVDSWVIPIPVVQCQNPGAGCAGGAPQEIIGVICFEVREVNWQGGEKHIAGNFLCASDERCDFNGLGPGGNIPNTPLSRPVLVQ